MIYGSAIGSSTPFPRRGPERSGGGMPPASHTPALHPTSGIKWVWWLTRIHVDPYPPPPHAHPHRLLAVVPRRDGGRCGRAGVNHPHSPQRALSRTRDRAFLLEIPTCPAGPRSAAISPPTSRPPSPPTS